MKTQDLGKQGEELAASFLKKNGYKILTRNFRSKFGEIDIVGLDPSTDSGQGTLVFVEVKTRWSQSFGPPEEAITPRKIKSIIKAGQYFKLLYPWTPESLRLDAVVIEMDNEGKTKRIELIKNLTS